MAGGPEGRGVAAIALLGAATAPPAAPAAALAKENKESPLGAEHCISYSA